MFAPAVEKAIKSQFAFALRNGSARLSINGKTVNALVVEPPITESEPRRGRQRGTKRAIVGALKSDLPTLPVPGTRAKLDSWTCVVAEEGIEEEALTWRITLRSP